MSTFNILMPKMGESIEEATITKWFVKVGDNVEEDQALLEIATDKVDSEIPSPVAGVVAEIRFETNALVPVGEVVAVLKLANGNDTGKDQPKAEFAPLEPPVVITSPGDGGSRKASSDSFVEPTKSNRFYSPLIKSIAKQEGIPVAELDKIPGTGQEGRLTKQDLLEFLKSKPGKDVATVSTSSAVKLQTQVSESPKPAKTQEVNAWEGDKVVEMDRLRKIIADHMVMSKQVSPHVTSIVEADVTNLVLWRDKHKDIFASKYGEKLTFMPVFTQAVAKALRSHPGINASVSGTNIILRKNVNVGIAVALPSGNLIVPVVKNADQKNLVGLAGEINRLANLARVNKLSPDDIQGGTFTITNFGSFKNIIGTPIINQPQVAILATGTIEKKPAVIETPTGDVIAIRHKMYLSLSYDHRVVDGALGGMFLREVADILEQWKLDEPV